MRCGVSELRAQLCQQIKDFYPFYYTFPIFETFIFLMAADDPEVLTLFTKFVRKFSDVRKDLLACNQPAINKETLNVKLYYYTSLIFSS